MVAESTDPVVYPTAYDSPQMERFDLDDAQWHKIRERPYQRHARRTVAAPQGTQLVLFPEMLAAEEEEAGNKAS